MTPLDAISWKQSGNFGPWHLAPQDEDETLCGLLPSRSGPWSITRGEFGTFATDPTSCRSCLEVWLRHRGKELHPREPDSPLRYHPRGAHKRPVLLGKPRCEVENHRPEDAGDGTLWCPTCKLPVEYA